MENILKVIKNEKDLNRAIGFYEKLFDAEDGTNEADIRDVLALLIEKYEDEHYPISLPDPIAAIKFRMEQQNLTQKDLMPFIGSRSKVSEVLSGKRELTLKMMRALHQSLGIPAEVLLREPDASLPETCKDWEFDKFPLLAMEKNGAFKGFDTTKIKDKAEEAIRWLLSKIDGFDRLPEFAFRKTDGMRLSANLNRYALLGWRLQVMAEASKAVLPVVSTKKNIPKDLVKTLVRLSVMDEGPKLAAEFLQKQGILLIVVTHLPSTYLDGAVFLMPNGNPVIALTLRYDRLDNFWFVVLHELGHILLGHLTKKQSFFADDLALRGSSDDTDEEKAADKFAELALLPESFNVYEKELLSTSEILEYAHENSVHPAIVAGRIQYFRKDYKKFSNLVGRGMVRKWFDWGGGRA